MTIGSTISVEGLGTATTGSAMAIFVGDYTIKNGADINTNAYCSVEVGRGLPPNSPPPPVQYSLANFTVESVGEGAKQHLAFNISNEGFLKFVGDFTGKAKVAVAAGGKASIADGVTVTLTHPIIPDSPSSVVIDASSGQIVSAIFSMSSGSKLVAPSGVSVLGRFRTLATGNAPVEVVGNIRVGAEGSLDISYNPIVFGGSGPYIPQVYSRLNVTGRVSIFGRFVILSVHAGMTTNTNGESVESVESDFIYSTGEFLFDEGSKLDVRLSNQGPGDPPELRQNRIWNVIESMDKIGGEVPEPLGITLGASKQGANKFVQIKVK